MKAAGVSVTLAEIVELGVSGGHVGERGYQFSFASSDEAKIFLTDILVGDRNTESASLMGAARVTKSKGGTWNLEGHISVGINPLEPYLPSSIETPIGDKAEALSDYMSHTIGASASVSSGYQSKTSGARISRTNTTTKTVSASASGVFSRMIEAFAEKIGNAESATPVTKMSITFVQSQTYITEHEELTGARMKESAIINLGGKKTIGTYSIGEAKAAAVFPIPMSQIKDENPALYEDLSDALSSVGPDDEVGLTWELDSEHLNTVNECRSPSSPEYNPELAKHILESRHSYTPTHLIIQSHSSEDKSESHGLLGSSITDSHRAGKGSFRSISLQGHFSRPSSPVSAA